ncbi:abortive infection protein [Formosa agariphila KMM 3901]|uniref:Abortive infection protein n=1 Tax=Formosa agariphila (strain DSM 15362 / KCTC 12365 / LMG 23005 / KMM 3901 / M-2Alg 35-1) TaxID=1347342 RepID=T2KJH9_FORAG|nr:type II CAAX endopeptidase family protein [Formosa agariphila]CDF78925.1 abortive infection protein [Formosa agariphila KMM 3901]
MYITQAYKGLTDWWRYIVGVILAFIGISIFSAPHLIAISMKTLQGDVDLSRMDDTNYILGLFESNLNLIFVMLPFLGGLIFLFIAVKYIHKLSILKLTTTRATIDWKRVFFSFGLWGAISSLFIIIDYTMYPENYLYNFQLNKFLILLVIALVLIPFQTSFEEYMFRGYLMQGIGVVSKTKWLPLILTSVIFGGLHIANPEVEQLGYTIMVYYIGTGLFLGVMTLMDEGMELSLGFHAANNFFTALLVTSDWSALQTYSVFKDISNPGEAGFLEIFLPVFVIFPILLFIFSKKYNWTDWKEKLTGRVVQPIPETLLNEDEKTIN